jgi:uncharacterized protein
VDFQFEWDEVKARSNSDKHGVTFTEATTIFADPFLLTFVDDVHGDAEDRFISIGESEQQRLLLVIHTERNYRIRLISARRATRKEQKTYEQRPA